MSNQLVKDYLKVITPGGIDTAAGPLTPGISGQDESVAYIPFVFLGGTAQGGGDAPANSHSQGQVVSAPLSTAESFYQIYTAGPAGWNIFTEQPAFFVYNGAPAPVNVLWIANLNGQSVLRVHYLHVDTVPPVFAMLPDVVTFSQNEGWFSGAQSIPTIAYDKRISAGGFFFQFTIPDAVFGVKCGGSTSPSLVPNDGSVSTVTHGFYMTKGALSIVDPNITLSGISHASGAVLKMIFTPGFVHYLVAGVEVASSPAPAEDIIQMCAQLYTAGDNVINPSMGYLPVAVLSFLPMNLLGGNTAAIKQGGTASSAPMTVSATGTAPIAMQPMSVFAADHAIGVGSVSLAPPTVTAMGNNVKPIVGGGGVSFQPMRAAATMLPIFGSVSSNIVMLGGSVAAANKTYGGSSLSMLPPNEAATGHRETSFEASMLDSFAGADFLSSGNIVSVVMTENLLFAALISTANFVDAQAFSSMVLNGTINVQEILNAIAVSLVHLGAVTPTFDDPGPVWVLNDDSGATSTYRDFAFNSFAKLGDDHYGMRSDGLYLLDGADDAGLPINASIAFGKQDFKTTAEKRVNDVYIGVASTGALVLRVTVEGASFDYVQQAASTELKIQRFVPGKGLRGNFIAFELFNPDASDFTISSVEFNAIPLTRRI